MAELPIMPVMTDAFLADAGDLPNELFGAYCRLLFRWWREGAQPEPNEKRLARWAGLTSAQFEDLKEFLTNTPDGWVQKKLVEVWTKQKIKSEKARASANARHSRAKVRNSGANASVGNAKSGKSSVAARPNARNIDADARNSGANASANAVLSMNHEPTLEEGNKLPSSLSVGEVFWADYPHPANRGDKTTTINKINKLSEADQKALLESLKLFPVVIERERKSNREYNPPMASTYINQRRWEGVIESVKGTAAAPVELPEQAALRKLAERMIKQVGLDTYKSWFTKDGKPLFNWDGVNIILTPPSGTYEDRWRNSMATDIRLALGENVIIEPAKGG